MANVNRMPETVAGAESMPRPGAGQAMPNGASPEGTPPQGGGVKELVTGINAQLMELLNILGTSNVADDNDRRMLAKIIMDYRNFVTEGLGKGPAGQQQPQMPKEARGGSPISGQYVDSEKSMPA